MLPDCDITTKIRPSAPVLVRQVSREHEANNSEQVPNWGIELTSLLRLVGYQVELTDVEEDAVGITKRQCAVLLRNLLRRALGPRAMREAVCNHLREGRCGEP